MTEPAPRCVRGCTYPGKLQDNGERGEPEPRPATHGLLCKVCATKLARAIVEIPELYATLDVRLAGGLSSRYDSDGSSKGAKRSHSPALVRLDVVALMDPRTVHSHQKEDRGLEDVVGSIVLIAEELRDALNLTSPCGTLTEACGLLKTWFHALTRSDTIKDWWEAITDIHHSLRRVNGIRGPRPFGHCQVCNNPLWADDDAESIRCSKCRTTYTGVNRLMIADSRAQAESRLGTG